MPTMPTFRDQLRRNAVALISLAIAITSLLYNTWRNEASEYNRNQRLVSIEMLLMLGDLNQIANELHYGEYIGAGALSRQGWAKVLTIRDLAKIASGDVPDSAEGLYTTWGADYKLLGEDVKAKERIVAALNEVRSDTHGVLRSLD